jgi:hypothetical protein
MFWECTGHSSIQTSGLSAFTTGIGFCYEKMIVLLVFLGHCQSRSHVSVYTFVLMYSTVYSEQSGNYLGEKRKVTK